MPTLEPIGVVRSPFREKAEAPRQATVAAEAEGSVELLPGRGFEDAVADLEGWERIWILFWFDRAEGWRPKVLPPRSDVKRGVFATRSPHRPNPIGLSSVELVAVEGLVLRVRGLDILDGTPVLDVKPYVAYADAFPRAKSGWLDPGEPIAPTDAGAAVVEGPKFQVVWSPLAAAQRDWLAARDVDVATPLELLLSTSPRPHAYRRIKPDGAGFRLAWKALRAWFRVEGRVVTLERLGTGYRDAQLANDPALDLHRDFVAAFS